MATKKSKRGFPVDGVQVIERRYFEPSEDLIIPYDGLLCAQRSGKKIEFTFSTGPGDGVMSKTKTYDSPDVAKEEYARLTSLLHIVEPKEDG